MPRFTPLAARLLPFLLPALANAADLDVTGPGGSGYATISEAVDAAADGDVVRVAPGTYAEDLDFAGKAITVRGNGGSPAQVIVQGSGTGPAVRFALGEPRAATLANLTVTGGDATPGTGFDGGCLHVEGSSPTLEDLVLHGCSAHLGGGIQLARSESLLRRVEIRDNQAVEDGDGAYGFGGGLYAFDSDLELVDVLIVGNRAARGGGAMVTGAGDLAGEGVVLRENTAERAGGLSLVDGRATLAGCTVVDNSAGLGGGGFWVSLGAVLTLDGCTITDNRARSGGAARVTGARLVGSRLFVLRNTAAAEGGGLLVDEAGEAAVDGSLLGHNLAAFGGAAFVREASLELSRSRLTANLAEPDGDGEGGAGGAVYAANGVVDVEGCLLDVNRATGDGGALRVQGDGTASVRGSIFAHNRASNGAGVHLLEGNAVLRHCTFAGDHPERGAVLRATDGSALTLTESIVAFPAEGSAVSAGAAAVTDLAYNDLFVPSGETTGDALEDQTGVRGNISGNPAFTAFRQNARYDDRLTLAPSSPAVDAGDPSETGDPDGTTADQGAHGGVFALLWEEPDPDGDGFTPRTGDCDEGDPGRNPAATETCGDGIDSDCDYAPDESDCGDEGPGDDDDDSADDPFVPPPTDPCGDCSLAESPSSPSLLLLALLAATVRRRR